MVPMLLHASCIALQSSAILISGPTGAGKSDLALRLIDEGAALIADDQTLLTRSEEKLIASAPVSIQGLIEVRHVGLLRMPFAVSAPVALYIELVSLEENLERLPDKDVIALEDVSIHRLRLPAFAASTPAKIRAALRYKIES